MKFDIDRFAKLAGMRTAAESTKSASPAAPAAVLKESAGRLAESAEIKNLRHIIRSETRAILAAKNSSKTVSDDALVEGVQRSKSFTEAMTTLGFLGPGFGGNNAFALGGAMTSASRFASLNEEDEMGNGDGRGRGPIVEAEGPPGALANQLHFAAIEKVHGLTEDFLNKILSLDEETLDLIAEVLGNKEEREELRSILNPKDQTGAFDQKQSGYDR